VTGVSEPVDRDALRIGTQELEDAIQALGDHFAAGRLPTDEYEQRVTGVLEAQTRGQLRQFFDDLPAPHPRFMTPLRTPPPAPLPLVPVPAYPPVMHTGYSDKSRVAAGLLQILLPFGIGRFYTGHIGIAVAQLLTVFVGVGVIWSMIDGVILLTAGGTDSYGRPLRI
jgi:TM2 domain-containing membrane protein YozV